MKNFLFISATFLFLTCCTSNVEKNNTIDTTWARNDSTVYQIMKQYSPDSIGTDTIKISNLGPVCPTEVWSYDC